jgi:hypothetical protein
MADIGFDVYINHCADGPLLVLIGQVSHFFMQTGLKVFYDERLSLNKLYETTREDLINQSRITIAFINNDFQSNESCMSDLRKFKNKSSLLSPIFPLICQEGPLGWASEELLSLCGLSFDGTLSDNRPNIDLISLVSQAWKNDDDHLVEEEKDIKDLHVALGPLVEWIKQNKV